MNKMLQETDAKVNENDVFRQWAVREAGLKKIVVLTGHNWEK